MSATAISVANFDYGSLEADSVKQLEGLEIQIRRGCKKMGDGNTDIGKGIYDARQLFAKEGQFKKWVAYIGFSYTTAINFCNVYERSGDYPEIATMPQTVAYKLAAPETPKPAIKEAMKRFANGEHPSVAWADEIVAKHEPKSANNIVSAAHNSAPSNTVTSTSSSNNPPNGPPTPSAPDSEETEEDEATEEAALEAEPEKELSFEEKVKEVNTRIESFCRQLKKWFEENCPKVESVDHLGRYDSALAQINAACSTMRTCKLHDDPCPKCKGEGCKTCEKESDFGAVSVTTYKQLAG